MSSQRTGGMVAVGVLNIVFGGMACVMSALVVLAGAFGSAFANELAAEMGTEASEASAAGGMLVLFGAVGLIYGVLLLVAGIGVLKVAPWGRKLSLASAGLKIVHAIGGGVLLSSLGFGTVIGLVYPLVLIGLFMKPDWKATFSGEGIHSADFGAETIPSTSASPIPSQPASEADEEVRPAA